MKHNRRFYRNYDSINRFTFNVKLDTSDLFIMANSDLRDEAFRILKAVRAELENYIKIHDEFIHSLNPFIPYGDEPEICISMCIASSSAGVGPMAAVAGAIAERVGKELLNYSEEVVVENGGDIWMKLDKPITTGIYVNNIYFNDNIGIKIYPEKMPCSICTSTSRLGHSISFGKADSVTIIAESGALADATATAVCNMVQTENDINNALDFGLSIDGIRGCLIVFRDKLAVQGDIELAPLK